MKDEKMRYKTWDTGWSLKKGIELYRWQTATYLHRKKKPRHMDFSDAGTGKSLPVLCNLFNWIHNRVTMEKYTSKVRFGEGRPLRNAVIFTPPSARIGWVIDAVSKFEDMSADVVSYEGCVSRRGRIQSRVQKINDTGRPVILLVSWGLLSAGSTGDISWLEQVFNPYYVVADEAQYISGHSSMRNRLFIKSIMYPYDKNDYKFVLYITATPFSNNMEQAWPYIYVCYESPKSGNNIAYPRGHTEFISYHFKMYEDSRDPRGYRLVNFKHADRIEKLVRGNGIVHKRSDVFKHRKEPHTSIKTFQLDKLQNDLYWYFVNNLYVEKDDVEISVKDSNTRMMRERQLATDPGLLGFPEANNKIKLLFSTLEEYGILPGAPSEKVLILTEFRGTWERVKRELESKGYLVEGIRGGDSQKSRARAIKKFTNDPNIQIFVGSRKSMAEGVNLQAASVHIDYELGWEPDKFIQGRGRVDRAGQRNRIGYIVFTAEDTIDYFVYNKVSRKIKFFDNLLENTAIKTKKITTPREALGMLQLTGLRKKAPKLSEEMKEKLKNMITKEVEDEEEKTNEEV
jgi:hypothetical protein